ncbi:DUF7948 domain-containing protein [Risungbinella massiliensis]|uniref:DUF7948 domain-containing protein n=1 Tax=Risungbinella massiliensis TaxID=1329796 RepID=UPI00069C0405|nr:SBBP repeat-containing protein [Risungbinella massiliensis]
MNNTPTKKEILQAYGKLPLSFIPNKGQKEARVQYYTQSKGFQCHFMTNEVLLTFFESSTETPQTNLSEPYLIQQLAQPQMERKIKGITLALRFIHANPQVKIEAREKTDGKVHYLNRKDSGNWQTDLSIYKEVVYRQLWPGVDLVFKGENGKLKYDLIVQPGADLNQIQFAYVGGDEIELDQQGNLQVSTPYGVYQEQKPISYQEVAGERKEVNSQFQLVGDRVFGFALGTDYDPNFPLVIDPTLGYSTLLGGSSDDLAFGIDIDLIGNAYVTGSTLSTNFPFTPGAFDTTYNGNGDAFVTKLNTLGNALVYSTFIGGSGVDQALAIAVDNFGQAYITGSTNSTDFPFTVGAVDTSPNGGFDAFVTKLNIFGNALVYSTYLGGSGEDVGRGIAVDLFGNAYVTGRTNSTNFPFTPGAFSTTNSGGTDAFVTKINPSGSALVYSTYLGGVGGDEARAIAVDQFGNAYVAGITAAPFPVTPGAFDTTPNGGTDGFVSKLNPSGSALVYSTYLGGNANDSIDGIAVDQAGNAYVTGGTNSNDFPVTEFAYDVVFNGFSDAFVTKLNPQGTALLYSTYLGGGGTDFGISIAVDAFGHAYVTGTTGSENFPTTPNAFDVTYNGSGDVFIARINTNVLSPNDSLVSSSYVGGTGFDTATGIAVNLFGQVFISGATSPSLGANPVPFPTTPNAFDRTFNGGGFDAFVLRIQL